ncbi:MAG: hypothetical protein ABIX12_15055 [Rubrivivax sp.]
MRVRRTLRLPARRMAVQAGEPPLWTFDKGAAKVNGAQVLRTR